MIVRPTWSTWSFLVYAGGLTFALALSGWLSYLTSKSGPAGDVGWALLLFAVLAAVAEWFRRTTHPVTAGVFAFGAVGAGVGALASLFLWIGWNVRTSGAIHGLHPALIVLEAAWIAIALAALRRYRFPLLVTHVALATWLHVGAGLAIGGAVLYAFRHGGTVEWVVVAVASVAYVLLARGLERSSWAVLGAVGLFVVADHFAVRWTNVSFFFIRGNGDRPWVAPFVFTCLGALLVALGLAVSRPRAAG